MPRTLSNWIGVNANQTKDGHPIVVMGPQTAYFVPQLLSEIAVKSNGGTELDFAGRGIITVNLPYIVIGRGSHYAWSATSGESDLIDTRVSKMCNMDGSSASRDDANGDGFPDAVQCGAGRTGSTGNGRSSHLAHALRSRLRHRHGQRRAGGDFIAALDLLRRARHHRAVRAADQQHRDGPPYVQEAVQQHDRELQLDVCRRERPRLSPQRPVSATPCATASRAAGLG